MCSTMITNRISNLNDFNFACWFVFVFHCVRFFSLSFAFQSNHVYICFAYKNLSRETRISGDEKCCVASCCCLQIIRFVNFSKVQARHLISHLVDWIRFKSKMWEFSFDAFVYVFWWEVFDWKILKAADVCWTKFEILRMARISCVCVFFCVMSSEFHTKFVW